MSTKVETEKKLLTPKEKSVTNVICIVFNTKFIVVVFPDIKT